jgi:hypothetical protein
MPAPNVVVTVEDHERFHHEVEAIGREANAKLVYLIDKAGQQIATFGNLDGVDPTSLASLTAGNVAATEGVAALVGESGFSSQHHEGARDSLYISVVAQRLILLVVFDERSSAGLVRLRCGQHTAALEHAWGAMIDRAAAGGDDDAPLANLTESDIEALFG